MQDHMKLRTQALTAFNVKVETVALLAMKEVTSKCTFAAITERMKYSVLSPNAISDVAASPCSKSKSQDTHDPNLEVPW